MAIVDASFFKNSFVQYMVLYNSVPLEITLFKFWNTCVYDIFVYAKYYVQHTSTYDPLHIDTT